MQACTCLGGEEMGRRRWPGTRRGHLCSGRSKTHWDRKLWGHRCVRGWEVSGSGEKSRTRQRAQATSQHLAGTWWAAGEHLAGTI